MSNPWLFTASLRRFLSGRIVIGLMLASASISLFGPSVASAHAEPQTANPPIDGTVRAAPERLEVWFVQEVFRRAGANALEVHDEAGERVDLDDLVIDDLDRTHLSVGLRSNLAAGVYTVTWRTLSAVDGDAADGTFTFTVDPTAPELSASAAPVDTEPPVVTPSPAASEAPVATATVDATPAATVAGAAEDDSGVPAWVLIAALGILGGGAAGVWALRTEMPE